MFHGVFHGVFRLKMLHGVFRLPDVSSWPQATPMHFVVSRSCRAHLRFYQLMPGIPRGCVFFVTLCFLCVFSVFVCVSLCFLGVFFSVFVQLFLFLCGCVCVWVWFVFCFFLLAERVFRDLKFSVYLCLYCTVVLAPLIICRRVLLRVIFQWLQFSPWSFIHDGIVHPIYWGLDHEPWVSSRITDISDLTRSLWSILRSLMPVTIQWEKKLWRDDTSRVAKALRKKYA